jgi:hypothetical protein
MRSPPFQPRREPRPTERATCIARKTGRYAPALARVRAPEWPSAARPLRTFGCLGRDTKDYVRIGRRPSCVVGSAGEAAHAARCRVVREVLERDQCRSLSRWSSKAPAPRNRELLLRCGAHFRSTLLPACTDCVAAAGGLPPFATLEIDLRQQREDTPLHLGDLVGRDAVVDRLRGRRACRPSVGRCDHPCQGRRDGA